MSDKRSRLKYYIYISDTKVDMLYEQIPVPLREKLGAELKIDLKFLSATWKQEPDQATRISKLRVVTEYIEKHEEIGTVDEPEPYFCSEMLLRWGTWRILDSETESYGVLFVGTTADTILVLGGSANHVVGVGGPEFSPKDHLLQGISTLQGIVWALEQLDRRIEIKKPDEIVRIGTQPFTIGHSAVGSLVAAHGPWQKHEFVAKRLLVEDYMMTNHDKSLIATYDGLAKDQVLANTPRILIGSPIYVAVAE